VTTHFINGNFKAQNHDSSVSTVTTVKGGPPRNRLLISSRHKGFHLLQSVQADTRILPGASGTVQWATWFLLRWVVKLTAHFYLRPS